MGWHREVTPRTSWRCATGFIMPGRAPIGSVLAYIAVYVASPPSACRLSDRDRTGGLMFGWSSAARLP